MTEASAEATAAALRCSFSMAITDSLVRAREPQGVSGSSKAGLCASHCNSASRRMLGSATETRVFTTGFTNSVARGKQSLLGSTSSPAIRSGKVQTCAGSHHVSNLICVNGIEFVRVHFKPWDGEHNKITSRWEEFSARMH